ncbi:hypothetical protein BDW62DRAFT_196801 [Aspergillus aurantiobrunneus]
MVTRLTASKSYGEFECTRHCSDFTSASFLNKVGKKTPVLQRVSTVGPESGSADTSRDVHARLLHSRPDQVPMNRSHKRHPQSLLPDANMFWDFHDGNPEGIYQFLVLFSDRGTPKSVRYMNSYSGHTYKFTKPTAISAALLLKCLILLEVFFKAGLIILQIKTDPALAALRLTEILGILALVAVLVVVVVEGLLKEALLVLTDLLGMTHGSRSVLPIWYHYLANHKFHHGLTVGGTLGSTPPRLTSLGLARITPRHHDVLGVDSFIFILARILLRLSYTEHRRAFPLILVGIILTIPQHLNSQSSQHNPSSLLCRKPNTSNEQHNNRKHSTHYHTPDAARNLPRPNQHLPLRNCNHSFNPRQRLQPRQRRLLQRRLWVIEKMLERMFVGHPPGLHDRLLDFSRPLTGCVFFAPSVDVLDGLDG